MKKETLRALRNKSGLTQAEVAQRLGISRTFYALIEQGKRRVSLGLAMQMADLFEVTLDALAGRDYPMAA